MAVNKLASIITKEINKIASESGTHNGTVYVDFKDIPLNIDGQEKVCNGSVKVNITFDWYKEEGDYDNPPIYKVDDLEYEIENFEEFIVEGDEDTYYTDDHLAKILKDNYDTLHYEIGPQVENRAYETDTSEDNEPDYDYFVDNAE